MSLLGLGTAQFGMPYGISNQRGQTPPEEIVEILALANESGIRVLDTAVAYGRSETALGNALEKGHPFRIVTKTPNFETSTDPATLLQTTFERSLSNLRQSDLYCLLVHNVGDLLGDSGDVIWKALENLRTQHMVTKIGVSVYTAEEIDAVLERFNPGLVQLPINLIDQRLITSGHLKKLKNKGIEVHARSIFLQGLLLMSPKDRPSQFHRFDDALSGYASFLERYTMSPLEAALAFVRHVSEIDVALVGVNNKSQLQECLEAFCGDRASVCDFSAAACNDEMLLNPALWPNNSRYGKQHNG